ncbi:hypothetical protein ACVINW_003937 [Bradyrhizobium sp. USDA 4461]
MTTSNTRVKSRSNAVTPNIPKNTVVPIACRNSAPAPFAVISGTTPRTKASEVMRIGLSRSRHACTTASTTLTGFRNIVEDGFDAGVRLGESVEKDMIAVRIGPDWRLVAVASAAYLKAPPKPKPPQDLLKHICIKRREAAGGHYVWEFGKNGSELRVRIDGQVTFNDSRAMIDAAVQGFGIAYVPEDMVVPQIRSGELVVVLDDWSPKFEGYYIYYPTSRQNSATFKVIVDALRRHEGRRNKASPAARTCTAAHDDGAFGVSSDVFKTIASKPMVMG